MGEFGGWDMPIQYSGILQEHHHTRTKAGIFDICHMGEFELSGPSACADLEKLLTCGIASMKIGQVRYGFMLNDEGGVLDDLTCYRLAEDRFMLVVNAGTTETDAAWIRSRISEGTVFIDRSMELAKIDVQGPESRRVMEEALQKELPALGYFRATFFQALETNCIISRTGYTGEWGYEIYIPVAEGVRFWNVLLQHDLVVPVGLGARDTLRLEMGYSLYGHELSERQSPVATCRGAFIDLSKDFYGKETVKTELEHSETLLVGLRMESKRAARAHDKVYKDNREAGVITSGSVAPSLGVAVALAFVKAELVAPGTKLQVEIRGNRYNTEVVDLPFYKKGTARGLSSIYQKT